MSFPLKKVFLQIYLLLFIFLMTTAPVLAELGVGVGTGKIVIDEDLRPGMSYNLPSLTVINTGDQLALYGIEIAHHEKQLELKPEKEWFRFEPKTFQLEPGESQVVEMRLVLPLELRPGNYFAYVRGFPYRTTESGQTAVNIAAAAKLSFTVAPANIFAAIYYRSLSFYQNNQPWTTVGLAAVVFIAVTALFKKFFSFDVNIKKKSNTDEK